MHLEDPGFQGFRFLATEGRWAVRLDSGSWGHILNDWGLGLLGLGIDDILLGLDLGLEASDFGSHLIEN
jgi:hypothetical protein